ncbi:MAG: hypothetical protein EOO10_25680 [Chitinophagaceae bacterium]|nr:MAG: hypothetical protein EOO10_25680 [Chitinophagaceae bacterium]
MFYKEWKFLAAHFLLKSLNRCRWRTRQPDGTYSRYSHHGTTLGAVKKRLRFWFSLEILKDAADLMYQGYNNPANEVKLLDNTNNSALSEIGLEPKGLLALKEWKYVRMAFKSVNGIILAVVGFISAIGSLWLLIKGCLLLLNLIKGTPAQ